MTWWPAYALCWARVRRRAWPERAERKTPGMAGRPMLTSKEKAWFFLTGSHQPKINKLIFLVIFWCNLQAQ